MDMLQTRQCRFLTLAGHRRAANNLQARAMSSVPRLLDQKRAMASGGSKTLLQPQRQRIPGTLAAIGPLPSLRNGHRQGGASCDTVGPLTCMVTGVSTSGLARGRGLRLRWIRGQSRFWAGEISKFGRFALDSSSQSVSFYFCLHNFTVLFADCLFSLDRGRIAASSPETKLGH